ncbi:hypothetical protein DPEC_G00112350 [Dallia pectoralis]|uniref:Uncharacterized protein n=1 Tax=Dallia pectoralis TaxID=75939 RepID=A0ACC2GTJ2_DALPE|nr:hypothetical protein DPEC_G00112350 [Dallia pectoralis]
MQLETENERTQPSGVLVRVQQSCTEGSWRPSQPVVSNRLWRDTRACTLRLAHTAESSREPGVLGAWVRGTAQKQVSLAGRRTLGAGQLEGGITNTLIPKPQH